MDKNFEKLNLNPEDSFIGNPGAWMIKKWERQFKEKLALVEKLNEEKKSVLKIMQHTADQDSDLETVKNEYVEYLRKNLEDTQDTREDTYLRDYIENEVDPLQTKEDFELALKGHLSTIEKHLKTLFETADPSPN